MKSDNSDSDSSEEFYDAEAPRYVSTATLCGIILELELKRKGGKFLDQATNLQLIIQYIRLLS
jgi:hypothetical protein